MNVSFQLYSSREVPSQSAFLSTLSGLGYTQVEGYGGVYDDTVAFRAALDAAGLAMPSGHFGVADLEDDFDGCLATAKTLGMGHIFAPYLDASQRPDTGAGYADFANRLSRIYDRVRDEGLTFGWHNHDFELVALSDGSVPLDVILSEAPDIAWEADLAWVIRGGADAGAWVDCFGSRIAAVHVKDIAPQGQKVDEDGWADVGDGTVDWAGLVAACRAQAPDALMVMEHDKPSDATRFATTSINSFKNY
ncbi:MAG: sugar phosphate isomerase/epimerase [Pseudomonadota bacterium]